MINQYVNLEWIGNKINNSKNYFLNYKILKKYIPEYVYFLN